MGEHARVNVRMSVEKIVQPVGPSVHQFAHLRRALRVVGLQFRLADVQPRAQILPDRLLALGFGCAAEVREIVRLDPGEIVFRLRVDHAEHGVGVSRSVDVGDAPIVASDRRLADFMQPASCLSRWWCGSGEEQEERS